jgi:hypothetical protein
MKRHFKSGAFCCMMLLGFCAFSSLHAQVTDQQVKDYVTNVWGVADVSDDVLSQTLDTSYSGIPYKDWITLFIEAPSIIQPLQQGNYQQAAQVAAQLAAGQSINSLLANVGLTGVSAEAQLAVFPIDFGIQSFEQAAADNAFKQELALYFDARQFNTAQEISDLQPGDLLDAAGNGGVLTKDDQGWLYRLGSYHVPNFTPQSFFACAEILYQAQLNANQFSNDERVVQGQFTAVATGQSPAIVTDLQDMQINEGGTATFTFVVSGTGPFFYQWYVNGQAYVSETNTFPATIPGTYQVVASNNIGSVASRTATLTVIPAAGVAITAPSTGSTLSSLTSVTVNAPTATQVQFYLDGVLMATSNSAPFAWPWDTTSVADGSHQLTAKAYNGATLIGTTSAVTVTVNNSTPAAGDDSNNTSTTATLLTFGQAMTGYISTPTDVDWFKVSITTPGTLTYNLTVPADKDFDLELYGPDGSYITGSYNDTGIAESIIYNVVTTGTYYVRVYGYPIGNGAYSMTESYTLNASFASGTSSITTPVQNVTVPWGASAQFSVVASNAVGAAISYQWQHNGVDIPGATGTTYYTPPTTLSQNGDQYSVKVTSVFGTVTSAATLTVNSPPSITWTGAESNDWNDPNNWDLGRVPNGSDVVRIASGVVQSTDLGSNFVILSGGAVTLTGSIFSNVTVAAGATLTLAGAGDYNPFGGSLYHGLGGTLTNYGTVVWQAGNILGLNPSAIVNQAGGVFEVQSTGQFTPYNSGLSFINAGTLLGMASGETQIDVPFTNTGTVNVQTGTLYMSGTLNNAGPINVSAGAQLDFEGTITLSSGATFGGGGGIDISGTVTGPINGTGLTSSDLYGDCTINGSLTLTGSIWSNVTVAAGAKLTLAGVGDYNPFSSNYEAHALGGTLTNYGTVVWQAGNILGTLNANNNPAIVNQTGGVFEIQSTGQMSSYNGQLSFTNAGTVQGMASGETQIDVPFTNTGTVNVQSGTLYVSGTLNNAGPINVSAGAQLDFEGTITLSSGATFGGAGGVDISGTVTGPINGNRLTSSDLYGDCTINGSLTLTGSIWSNVTVAAGAKLTLAGAGDYNPFSSNFEAHALGATLTNYGTVVWQAGNILGTLNANNNPAIVNQAGGVFEVQSTGQMSSYNGQLSFTNIGTVQGIAIGETQIYCAFTNTGTVNVESGTLYFSSAAVNNAGAMNVSAGAQLDIEAGANLSSGAIFNGAGGVDISGTVTGPINGTGLTAGLTSSDLYGNCTINGNLTLTGSIWSNVTVAAGATLTLAGPGDYNPFSSNYEAHALGATLTNYGTVVWQAGNILGTLNANNNPAILNQAGGVFEIQSTGQMSSYNGQLSFTNDGTVQSTTSGETQIFCAFTNTGMVNVQSGTLYFSSAAVNNAGAMNVSAGAQLDIEAGATLSSGATFNGAGGVDISGTVTGQINGTGLTSSDLYGDCTINGSLTLTGSIWSNVTVAAGATLTLAGAGDYNPYSSNYESHALGATLTNYGTVVWQAGNILGTLNANNNPAIVNQAGGVFEIQSTGQMSSYNGQLSFTNAGTVQSTVSGETQIQVPFTNTGTVNVQSGTLYFTGMLNNAGPINVSAGAQLDFEGTITLSSGAAFNGAGGVDISGTVTGPINGIGLTSSDLYGDCTINGSLTLTGSIWSNVTVAAGATLTLAGAGDYNPFSSNYEAHALGATLTNYGTVVWQAGNILGTLNANNSPAIVNQAGGVFEVQSTGQMSSYNGQLTFTNAGTLQGTANGETQIFCAFTNTGIINVQTGTLYVSGTLNSAGPINVSAGAQLDFEGTIILSSGATFNGAGGVDISGTVTGPINGTGLTSSDLYGDCTINGSLTLSGSIWSNVTVAAGATLTITGNGDYNPFSSNYAAHALGGTLTNYGTVVWQAGNILGVLNANNTPAIVNQAGGVFEVQSTGTLGYYNGQLNFTNAGTIQSMASGETQIEVPFTNTGTVNVQTGTLYFSSYGGSSVTLNAIATSFSTWASELGLTGAAAQLEARPFQDGLPNLVRYAMNLSVPSTTAQSPAVSFQSISGIKYLTLQYRRLKGMDGIQMTPQYSTDLVNWTTVPAENIVQMADDDVNTQRWAASIAIPNSGPIFLRVEVNQSQ